MTDKNEINKVIVELDRKKNRRRSVEAILLLFAVIPIVVGGILFAFGAFA